MFAVQEPDGGADGEGDGATNAGIAGATGRRKRAAMVEEDRVRVRCDVGWRQRGVPVKVFGEIVRVSAYARRR